MVQHVSDDFLVKVYTFLKPWVQILAGHIRHGLAAIQMYVGGIVNHAAKILHSFCLQY